jgi:hypothetical protein
MDGSAEFVKYPDFYSKSLPADPGGVALSDVTIDPWDKWIGNAKHGGPLGRHP